MMAFMTSFNIFRAKSSGSETAATTTAQRDMRDEELIPGTEVMSEGTGTVVLVPSPSRSLADPLNWSLTWKVIAASTQLIYVWVAVTSALSLAPVFPLLGAQFHLDQQQLSLLTGLNVITLGFANIFIVPLSNIFGRRMTSILFGVLLILTCIWEALATSHHSLLAARACNGIAAATSESVMVQMIADMFFLSERGTMMGVYFTTYFMGSFLGPIMSGNIVAKHGWRSCFWLSTALAAVALVLVIIAQPETKFHRDHVPATETRLLASPVPTTDGKSGSLEDVESPPEVSLMSAIEEALEDIEKGSEANKSTAEKSPSSPEPEPTPNNLVGKGHPTRAQFLPWQRPDKKWKSFIVRDLTTPLIVFFNPIIFWAGLMLAGPADLLLIYNLTESTILAAPPYNFTASGVGYSNFGFAVGGLVGIATAGPFSDWLATRSTRHNAGIREPEMRLPALLPYALLTLTTSISGGYALQHTWPWPALVVLCYGLSGLSVASLPTIAVAYAIDCFKPISGEIMVVGTVLKNSLGFCLSYWIFGVAGERGWTAVFWVQMGVTMAPVLASVPLWWWGKRLRRFYAGSALHRMEEMI